MQDYSPLQGAVVGGIPDYVKKVLETNPDVNERVSLNGFTPLHFCVSGPDEVDKQEIIKLLYHKGANLELKTFDKGLTPLQLAAMHNKPLCLTALLECGANVNAVDHKGATALHSAAFQGFHEVCKILLEHGGDPYSADKNGDTPIFLAKNSGYKATYDLFSNLKNSGNEKALLKPHTKGWKFWS